MTTTTPAEHSARNTGWPQLTWISHALIQPAEYNPRRRPDEADLQELAESIRQHGILEPLIVRHLADSKTGAAYSLVAGERRWRAAEIAGLSVVPCVVRDDLDNRGALQVALVENLQREGLDPVEEAEGYRRLHEAGLKQSEIAAAVHKAQPTIANRLRLLELPADVRERIRKGELSAAHGVALARFSQYPAVVSKMGELAAEGKVSSHVLETNKVPMEWALTQAGLVRFVEPWRCGFDAEPCKACPHRRASEYGGETCLDPACYDRKEREARAVKQAKVEQVVEEARAGGEQLPATRDFGYGNYHNLSWEKAPEGCQGDACPKQVRALEGSTKVQLCTDVKCWQRLKTAATRAANKATKAEVQKLLTKAIPEAVSLIGAPLPDGGNRELASRELAVVAYYALRGVSGDALEAAFPELRRLEARVYGVETLQKLSQFSRERIVASAVKAILCYEQMERLKEYTEAGTHASEFYLKEEG